MKRCALVTGGSGEIGAAICYQLAQQNYHLIVHTHQQVAKAEQVANTIIESGGSAQVVQFDVTNAENCAAVLTQLTAENLIQVLVNNAGIHKDAPLAGMKREDWKQVIDVSLHGFYNVRTYALTAFKNCEFRCSLSTTNSWINDAITS